MVVHDKKYSHVCLQSSYAYAVHCYYKKKWENYCITELMANILNTDITEVHDVVEYFSIPEFSIERDQVELKTMDYTHMLTNMQNHILTHGYEFCPKEHFHHIADNRPDILSRALVHDKIDIQNAFFAMKMFSKAVEDYLCENSFKESADFICLVRQWHSACNLRGIHVDERMHLLTQFHNCLMKDINFDKFPPQFCHYVKGMPIQTYEAILQNISCQLQLYEIAFDGMYNTRAISTLSNERVFFQIWPAWTRRVLIIQRHQTYHVSLEMLFY